MVGQNRSKQLIHCPPSNNHGRGKGPLGKTMFLYKQGIVHFHDCWRDGKSAHIHSYSTPSEAGRQRKRPFEGPVAAWLLAQKGVCDLLNTLCAG